MMPRISVVIPTLNDCAALPGALTSCVAEGVDEVVVVDGGSTDGTPGVAAEAGVLVVSIAQAQRAAQMNAGVAEVTGDAIIFLHADTRFESGAIAALRLALQNPSVYGGGFYRSYNSPSLLLTLSSCIGNYRARRLGWYYGDQAIWVRRDVFWDIGGYPDQGRFEDLDFSRLLGKRGGMVMIHPGVNTSARRFEKGVAARWLCDLGLCLGHVIRNRGLKPTVSRSKSDRSQA